MTPDDVTTSALACVELNWPKPAALAETGKTAAKINANLDSFDFTARLLLTVPVLEPEKADRRPLGGPLDHRVRD